MPKRYYLLVVALMPLLLWAQAYTISGRIGNLNSPAIVYLAYKIDGKNLVDSTSITNGVFTFKGTVQDPMYAALVVDHAGQGLHNLQRGMDMLKFYIEKGNITITSPDSVGRAIPQNFLVDPDGKIIASQLTSWQLAELLDKLLAP